MRSRAKSNRKWKSNGKRGTSRNQFLRARVFSCVFVFLPFETSGSASCRTIGFLPSVQYYVAAISAE